ncbi:MAG: nuclear transport factor 2 family protein [Gammaproteobacteria bacterium]|nr:nuclear transport factor 2 family protein [Gammaproteobacteria bacterium]
MQEQQRRDIQRDCEALSIAYARAIDFRDYDDFITLFAEDAALDLGRPMLGREAIRASISQRPDGLRSRHVISNIFIDVIDTDNARGISYLTLYRHLSDDPNPPAQPIDEALPAAVGHYQDQFVRATVGWRFQSRTLHLAFRDPAAF